MLDPNVGGFVEGTRAEDLVVQSLGGWGLGQVMSTGFANMWIPRYSQIALACLQEYYSGP